MIEVHLQRRRMGLGHALSGLFRGRQRSLQTFQQDAPHGQAAITLVGAFDHVPGREIAAAQPQDLLAVAHEFVVGLGLLPVQRADAPAVQRVVLQRVEACIHLVFREMEPELEDQHAFVAEHALQTLRAGRGQLQLGTLDAAMHAILEHLAVPVAEEDAGMPLRRQPPPEAPGRGVRQLFVAGHIEAVDPNQPGVHPLVEQLDGLALARPFDTVDQDQNRELRLGLEPVLRLQERLAQVRHCGIVGGLVDGVTNFG